VGEHLLAVAFRRGSAAGRETGHLRTAPVMPDWQVFAEWWAGLWGRAERQGEARVVDRRGTWERVRFGLD